MIEFVCSICGSKDFTDEDSVLLVEKTCMGCTIDILLLFPAFVKEVQKREEADGNN